MKASVCDIECVHNPLSKETTKECDWCKSIINYQPKEGWNVFLTPEDHERAIAQFGGPQITSKNRWHRLMQHHRDGKHVEWAKLDPAIDPIRASPCSVGELGALAKGIAEGRMLTRDEQRWLQMGIEFHDGSILRYIRSAWYLDDVVLPSLSLSALFPLLTEPAFQRGWNLSALVVGLASCAPMKNEVFTGGPIDGMGRHDGAGGIRSHYRPLASMLLWLTYRLQVDRNQYPEARERIPMMAWAHDIQTRLLAQQPHDLRTMFGNALSNHPPGLFELYDTPWMRAWQNLGETNHYPRTLNWSMRMSNRHVEFRVRTRSGNTRLVRVPEQPEAWALLISLAHSPLNSSAGKLLLGLQHNWSVAYTEESQPSKPLLLSLKFCHQIMNGLPERIFIEHATALVLGKLGHLYEIRVGSGQHGAPYRIHHKYGLHQHEHASICIHSGQYAHRLPLGDTMGSVLLSMANDVKAMESIRSLEDVLLRAAPFGFPPDHVPNDWLDALDQQALRSVRIFDDGAGGGWFEPQRPQRQDMMPPNRPFGMVMLAHRNRMERRRNRINEWGEIFEQAFEDDGEFPYHRVVAAWRETVGPYKPFNHEEVGGLFGLRANRWMRRYHHLMPHRRVDDVHDEGDIRDGERRWCEVFARIWEVLSLQPLGSHVNVPSQSGGMLSFQHANLAVTIRNPLERNVVQRMAHCLGYVAHGNEAQVRTLVRRDHPRPDARLELTDVLRLAQERQGVRGAPPRWWNYCEIGRAPEEMPHLRWELQIDLTDDRQPQRDMNLREANFYLFDVDE